MKFIGLVVLFLGLTFLSPAKSIRIGLFTDQTASDFTVTCLDGHFHIKTSSQTILQLSAGNEVRFTKVAENVRIQSEGKILGVFSRLTVASAGDGALFSIIPGESRGGAVSYKGSLELKVRNNRLAPVNIVELEEYTASVVESEISNLEHEQMLKVQAILTRTFTLGNLDRHTVDGFSLCDRVHCQVYNGRKRYNVAVHQAVRATHDKVVVGPDKKILLAAYHSNCGGQTAPSGDAWSQQVSTLVVVVDTFCSNSPHARWRKSISLSRWESYLRSKGVDCSEESLPCAHLFIDSLNRSCCVRAGELTIPAKVIRRDLDFKSAYFTISIENDSVVFNGKGYGHGVGLCQEGAAAMAQAGYSVEEIIRYYYCDVRIVRYHEWKGFSSN